MSEGRAASLRVVSIRNRPGKAAAEPGQLCVCLKYETSQQGVTQKWGNVLMVTCCVFMRSL